MNTSAHALKTSALDPHTHLMDVNHRHQQRLGEQTLELGLQGSQLMQMTAMQWPQITPTDWMQWVQEQSRKTLLTLDVLRRAGDTHVQAEAKGHEPVLDFAYSVVMDGAALEKPVNYQLLHIEASGPIDLQLSPIMIIDPRAGHGPGIGGFKADSEVGVAMKAGHPVYFVSFKDHPLKDQTITDVVMAHGQFLAEVTRRHPKAHAPVVMGNCQGGWAAMLMAATHPHQTGALVLNGAPLSYWAGQDGQNPMRYMGGLLGGQLPATLAADLSDGTFDGAHLVMNFESLNPANTWFRKYKDLYDKVDTEQDRFLEFDRWWSGFYRMNGAEIRWILENLFIGNRLGHGQVKLDNGMAVKLTAIDAPIFIFASWGDNITPPAQALGWILDTYSSDAEIAARGQRIIYTLHKDIGHLGIFVSQQVALREHTAIESIVDYAQALPPGLYEMHIEQDSSPPVVRFHERTRQDIQAMGGPTHEREKFERVQHVSEWVQSVYDQSLGPVLKATQTESRGELMRATHPLRLRRALLSTSNPLMHSLSPSIEQAKSQPANPLPEDHPLHQWDRQWSAVVEKSWAWLSQKRDADLEVGFHALYGALSSWPHQAEPELQALAEEHSAAPSPLWRQADGSDAIRADVVLGMLLLIHARGGMRGSHLKSFRQLMQEAAEFSGLTELERESLLREQAARVLADSEAALRDVGALTKTKKERLRIHTLLQQIVGKAEQLSDAPQTMMHRIEQQLNLRPQDKVGKEAKAAGRP